MGIFNFFKKKEKKRKGFWEIKKTRNGEYHFVLKAPNNKVIAQGETYKTFDGCWNGIESVKENVNAPIKWDHRTKS